jgi:hypothetical protein
MGYSCTKDASDMLGLIRHSFSDGKTSNGLTIGGRSYFYEVGRENADGSITGSLYMDVDESNARIVGRFKVNADGRVLRFPRITRDQRVALMFKFGELQRTNPMLLSSYSHGSI